VKHGGTASDTVEDAGEPARLAQVPTRVPPSHAGQRLSGCVHSSMAERRTWLRRLCRAWRALWRSRRSARQTSSRSRPTRKMSGRRL